VKSTIIIKKKVVIVAIIIALFAVAIVYMPREYSAETEVADSEEVGLTASEKGTEFLSNVVGLDLAKYNLTKPPSDAYSYPPKLCGLVKEEIRDYKYEATGSKISITGFFYNGQMGNLKIYNLGGDYIYSEPPATDLLNQTKTILQRYQAYAMQVDATDTSYLKPMHEILNSLSDLSPTNITVGNVNFQVSKNGDKTRIQWIYAENGVIIDYKRVDLSFLKNSFLSFRDTWRIYSVGAFSVINSEEAYKLALDTAQNCEFRIVNDKVNETVPLPDLSNAVYQMYFTMLPYQKNTEDMPSKISRDPLTLYPYWQFFFYFKGEEIGGYSGVQVGIWGDTKEIIYCNGFGFLGTSGTPSDDEGISSGGQQQQQEQPSRSEQPTSSEQTNPSSPPPVLAAVIITTVISALLISAIVLRHRNQRKS